MNFTPRKSISFPKETWHCGELAGVIRADLAAFVSANPHQYLVHMRIAPARELLPATTTEALKHILGNGFRLFRTARICQWNVCGKGADDASAIIGGAQDAVAARVRALAILPFQMIVPRLLFSACGY